MERNLTSSRAGCGWDEWTFRDLRLRAGDLRRERAPLPGPRHPLRLRNDRDALPVPRPRNPQGRSRAGALLPSRPAPSLQSQARGRTEALSRIVSFRIFNAHGGLGDRAPSGHGLAHAAARSPRLDRVRLRSILRALSQFPRLSQLAFLPPAGCDDAGRRRHGAPSLSGGRRQDCTRVVRRDDVRGNVDALGLLPGLARPGGGGGAAVSSPPRATAACHRFRRARSRRWSPVPEESVPRRELHREHLARLEPLEALAPLRGGGDEAQGFRSDPALLASAAVPRARGAPRLLFFLL